MRKPLLFGNKVLSHHIGQAIDAFGVLEMLIDALKTEYLEVANELALMHEYEKSISKINNMLITVDKKTVSRTINNFDDIKKAQNEVAALYGELKDKITPFINEKSSKHNVLERETLIANLMEECTTIIERALPNILKSLNNKHEATHIPPANTTRPIRPQ